ncbi:hypothetical protein Y032_0222g2633 [Ancylostoma ceylanicum]|uniref:Uncharacterized protein n=1 Tax=Ancylostoma ceylanicum TaxID=53326 RepID=A0A016SI10_9BILA|nr:hypothetical protein Y032_0222g2633 [Ancylostoma ceylanicum]
MSTRLPWVISMMHPVTAETVLTQNYCRNTWVMLWHTFLMTGPGYIIKITHPAYPNLLTCPNHPLPDTSQHGPACSIEITQGRRRSAKENSGR